jgi:hypothetical protein
MPERSPFELLSEWRQVMESMISSAASAAGRSELPGDVMRATQRQLELLGQIVEREQRLQGGLVDGLLAPVDAVFDLLAESGATLRRQAETMEAAGRALQETAALMKQQAELFEKTISLMRQPTTIARAAAGRSRRAREPEPGAEPHPRSDGRKGSAARGGERAPAKPKPKREPAPARAKKRAERV